MKISILIVTKERRRALKECLRYVSQSQQSPDEVVIVDGSVEKDAAIQRLAKELELHIVYKYVPDIGLSDARNTAVHTAKGDIVIFVDDDCRISPDAFSQVARRMKKLHVDAVVGQIMNGDPQSVTMSVQQAYYDLWVQRIATNQSSAHVLTKFIPGLDIAAFRRSILLKFPFRTDLPYGIDEDIELGARMCNARHVMYFDPAVSAYHFGRASIGTLFWRNFLTGYANEYTKRHYGANTRAISRRATFAQKLVMARRNSMKIPRRLKIVFWIVFGVYPIFSGLGRLSFFFVWSITRFFRYGS